MVMMTKSKFFIYLNLSFASCVFPEYFLRRLTERLPGLLHNIFGQFAICRVYVSEILSLGGVRLNKKNWVYQLRR